MACSLVWNKRIRTTWLPGLQMLVRTSIPWLRKNRPLKSLIAAVILVMGPALSGTMMIT